MYRFRTEQEFVRKFGNRWENKVKNHWVPEMNIFFGNKLNKYLASQCYKEEIKFFNFEGYNISKDMIVLEDSNPYRKFIFKYF